MEKEGTKFNQKESELLANFLFFTWLATVVASCIYYLTVGSIGV